jgi:hypothetical protein|tara:strand:- start:13206 stop:13613 length:408 start_codon:yes stop_codon:yes gene_type:complete
MARGGFKVNKSALAREFDKIRDFAEAEAKSFTNDIADDAIRFSINFVDTGAYITSFSFSTGSGRPRGVTSRRKHRNPSAAAQKAVEGRGLLAGDIEKLNFDTLQTLKLRNGSPHAEIVEENLQKKVFKRLGIKYG